MNISKVLKIVIYINIFGCYTVHINATANTVITKLELIVQLCFKYSKLLNNISFQLSCFLYIDINIWQHYVYCPIYVRCKKQLWLWFLEVLQGSEGFFSYIFFRVKGVMISLRASGSKSMSSFLPALKEGSHKGRIHYMTFKISIDLK